MNENDVTIIGLFLLLQVIFTVAILLRARMVLGKNSQAANMYFFSSMFLGAIVAWVVSFIAGEGWLLIAVCFVLQALIFISQENKLPVLKKEQAEQQAELERRVAQWQQQQDEAKKTKEKLITKWLDKEGINDDSPKAEQQAESERRAAEWQQQQDEAKKKNEKLMDW